MENQARKTGASRNRKNGIAAAASAAEQDYRLLFESAVDGLALVHGRTGEIVRANRTFERLSGYSGEELKGKKFGEVPVIKGLDLVSLLTRAGEGQHFFADGLQVGTKGEAWIDAELLCTRHGGGRAVLCNVRDVRERKRKERARARSEDQFRRLFEGHHQPMWVFDTDTLAFLAVNEGALRIFGYPRDEFLSLCMSDLLAPAEAPDFLDSIGNPRSPLLKPDIWKLRRANGDLIDVEIASNELQFNGRNARFAVASDVTARKQAEDLLR
jgi:two-component system cell cycle sensor histidine kinase/response regulator CckA